MGSQLHLKAKDRARAYKDILLLILKMAIPCPFFVSFCLFKLTLQLLQKIGECEKCPSSIFWGNF